MNRREFSAGAAMALGLGGASTSLARTAPPLSAWGALPAIEQVALSDDATRLAFIGVSGDARRLVLQTIDGALLGVIGLDDAKVIDIQWAGNDDIVVTTARTTAAPELGLPLSEFYSAQTYSLSRKRFIKLASRVPRALGFVLRVPEIRVIDGKAFAYCTVITLGTSTQIVLARIAVADGAVAIIDSANPETGNWMVSESGEAVARSRYDQSSGMFAVALRRGGIWPEVFQRRALLDRPWLEALTADGQGAVVSVFDEEGYEYVEVKADGGARLAIPSGRAYRAILRHARSSRMIGGMWFEDYSRFDYFEPVRKASWESAQKTFKGQRVFPQAWSADSRKIVVFVEGAANSGAYYLVNLDARRADLVGEAWPLVTADWIGEIKPYAYKASDGLDIPGYLTLPPGLSSAKGLPLIVLPHGGPASHNELTFDWWAQALASRGYAVLQPNFRGSTGQGLEHLQAGFGQWGRRMQTDLSDGVKALAAAGIIDPGRVAIVGGSYGGYAAMAGPTLDPGHYRCAVAVAGVSDLRRMLTWSANRYGEKSETTRYWTRFMGGGCNDPALDEISPLRHAARADAPILLIHGKDDTVVPYEQSALFAEALKRAGKSVDLVTLKGEDHDLARGETRLRMLEATLAFLQTHNPPG